MLLQSIIVGFHPEGGQYQELVTEQVKSVQQHLRNIESRSTIILRNATADVASYYGAADIFILNSDCENFGMVSVEAILAGLPVIAQNLSLITRESFLTIITKMSQEHWSHLQLVQIGRKI